MLPETRMTGDRPLIFGPDAPHPVHAHVSGDEDRPPRVCSHPDLERRVAAARDQLVHPGQLPAVSLEQRPFLQQPFLVDQRGPFAPQDQRLPRIVSRGKDRVAPRGLRPYEPHRSSPDRALRPTPLTLREHPNTDNEHKLSGQAETSRAASPLGHVPPLAHPILHSATPEGHPHRLLTWCETPRPRSNTAEPPAVSCPMLDSGPPWWMSTSRQRMRSSDCRSSRLLPVRTR